MRRKTGSRLRDNVGMALDKELEKFPTTATIKAIDGAYADIQLGNSTSYIRHCNIIGDPTSLVVGQEVSIKWDQNKGSYPRPVVIASEGGMAGTVTNVYYQGALEHSHPEYLEANGWQTTLDGTLFNLNTSLTRDGTITLGVAPNYIKLSSIHATYRMWAGAVDPASATFSVSKTGAIKATSGDIGGWNLGTDYLNADSGSTELKSSTPSIRLGATDYTTGTGIWMGKNDSIYKFRVGNPSGNLMDWDGTDLEITGTIIAVAGEIGGWNIGSDYINDDTGNVELKSSVPSIRLGATNYTTGDGIWMGYDSSLWRMRVGNATTDTNAQFIQWDGSDLTISGSVRSDDYVSGFVGWAIQASGDAEFGNVRIRGTLSATVFEYNQVSATAGTLGVFPSASKATAGFTSPTIGNTFHIYADNYMPGDVSLFAQNDVLFVKHTTSTGINIIYATVSTTPTNMGEYSDYTCVLRQGSESTAFPEGVAIIKRSAIDTEMGEVTISADGGQGPSSNITMSTFLPTLTPSWGYTYTPRLRIGNLRNSWGYADTDKYGVVIGQYGTGLPNLTWDEDDGLRIRNYETQVFGVENSTGTVSIGPSTAQQLKITSSNITFYRGGADYGVWSGTAIRIGRYYEGHTYVHLSDTDGIRLRLYTTTVFQVVYDGVSNCDMIVGQTGSSKANMFFDGSSGRLNFRAGEGTAQAYIETDGTIRAGGGVVKLDTTGLSCAVNSTETYPDLYGFTLRTGSTTHGGLRGYTYSGVQSIGLIVDESTSYQSQMHLYALGGAGKIGTIYIGTQYNATATMNARITMQSTSDYRYTRVSGGGFFVGDTGWSTNYPWQTSNGYIAAENAIYAGSETVGAPAFSFRGDRNTGMYNPSDGQVALACNGVAELTLTGSLCTIGGTIRTNTGSYSTPAYSFSSDQSTGFYRSAAGTVAFSSAGTAVGRWDASGPVAWLNFGLWYSSPKDVSTTWTTVWLGTVPAVDRTFTIRRWYQSYTINGGSGGSYWQLQLVVMDLNGNAQSVSYTTCNVLNAWRTNKVELSFTIDTSEVVIYVRTAGNTGGAGPISIAAPQIYAY